MHSRLDSEFPNSSYPQKQYQRATSYISSLIHTACFGICYGVGYALARFILYRIQHSPSKLSAVTDHDSDNSSGLNFNARNVSTLMIWFKERKSYVSKRFHRLWTKYTTSTHNKSLMWFVVLILHPIYCSAILTTVSFAKTCGNVLLLSMYPFLVTVLTLCSNDSDGERSGTGGRTSSSETGHQNTEELKGHESSSSDPSATLLFEEFNEKKTRSDSIGTQTYEDTTHVHSSSDSTTSTRYLEMLVHNVSHTDLVLNLELPLSTEDNAIIDYGNGVDETKACPSDNQYKSPKSLLRTNWFYHSTKSDLKSKCKEEEELDSSHQPSNLILCRPRFSAFDMFSRRILEILRHCHSGPKLECFPSVSSWENLSLRSINKDPVTFSSSLFSAIMSFQRYERSESMSRYSLIPLHQSRQNMLPVGFNLARLVSTIDNTLCGVSNIDKKLEIDANDLMNLRIRGKDITKLETVSNDTKMRLGAIFFPLLSSLIRRWHEQMNNKYGHSNAKRVKKVIILVTGVGTPRNYTHSMMGNSTEACAELMEMFIKTLYPDVTVVRLHSKTEIFRYDENIKFATRELMPCVDAYRDAHARGEPYPDERVQQMSKTSTEGNCFDPDWKQSFSVTLSFADGAPARTHAIQAALRSYRPQYFHFWQLKTFWHDTKICDDDIEIHSFEELTLVPAMEVAKTSPQVQLVVAEMKKFREFFLETVQNERNDVRQFWLRKTKKPVLAVLLVEHPGGALIMYRGTNMEVSMPTGSLCAERNVIGSALANNPGLKREDLRMVAVLAVPLPSEENAGEKSMYPITLPHHPSQIGQQTNFFTEVETKLKYHERREGVTRSMSVGSFASIIEGDDYCDDDRSLVLITSSSGKISEEHLPAIETPDVPNPFPIPREAKIMQQEERPKSPTNVGISTPVRRISLYLDGEDNLPSLRDNRAKGPRKKKRRTVLVHSSDDINPLKPCGACNEWLKKIAECNPTFKIITFTDADCNGVYVNQCHDE